MAYKRKPKGFFAQVADALSTPLDEQGKKKLRKSFVKKITKRDRDNVLKGIRIGKRKGVSIGRRRGYREGVNNTRMNFLMRSRRF